MRILHTSDWHLGHRLINLNRDGEQQAALDWLLHTIIEERVDVLLVAGDIFDTSTPPVQIEAMYYRFLAQLVPTACRHVVITGGNHDSAAKLNAPKPLLDALKIHIVGQSLDPVTDEVIVFDGLDGKPELVVAAVPFLRDFGQLITNVAVSVDERRDGIRLAIKEHFDAVGTHAASLGHKGVPHVCMGHLCIGGEEVTADQKQIYLGDSHTMSATDFHPIFGYVALGHIHRPMKMNKSGTVRYAGSLIPLSFSEVGQRKVVQIVDFEGDTVKNITDLEVPMLRRLVRISCTMDTLALELSRHSSADPAYPTWAEVILESEQPVPQIKQMLDAATEHLSLDILKHSNVVLGQQERHTGQLEQIAHLDPIDVFERKCRQDGRTDNEVIELLEDFKALREWMVDK